MERVDERVAAGSKRVGLGQLTTGAKALTVALPVVVATAMIGICLVGGRALQATDEELVEEAQNRAGAIVGLENRLVALEARANGTDLLVRDRVDGLDQALTPIGPAIVEMEARLAGLETRVNNSDAALRDRLDGIDQALSRVGLTIVRKVWTDLNLEADFTAELWAECPAGQVAVGGGHDSGNRWLMIIEDMPDPSAAQRWIVRVWNHDDTDHGAGNFIAYAICAPRPLVAQVEAAGAVTAEMRVAP